MSIQSGVDMLNSGGDSGEGNTPGDTTPPVSTPTDSPGGQETPQSTGGHPAWDEILTYVQPDKADIVRQRLREWDSGVSRRFDEVQSKFKPYEPFIGHDPQSLEQALTLFNVFNGDPRRLYDQMAEHFGFNRGQGQNNDSLDVGEFADEDEQQQMPDITQHPMFQQLAAQQQAMQQMLAQRAQEEEQAKYNGWVESEMTRLKAENPGVPWDQKAEEYVLTRAGHIAEMTGNADTALEHAVTDYIGLITNLRGGTGAPAPKILPTSGGMPLNNVNPKDMTDKDRRNLGVELLKQMSRET